MKNEDDTPDNLLACAIEGFTYDGLSSSPIVYARAIRLSGGLCGVSHYAVRFRILKFRNLSY
jgi:hypothetical protein